MDSHQQHGAFDALIQDGLAMQGLAHELDQLVHESCHEVLGGQLSDAHGLGVTGSFGLPSIELPLPNGAAGPEGASYGDLNSQVKEAQHTATTRRQSRFRPRRRSASAAVNLLTTDAEGSDADSEECNKLPNYGEDRQDTGSSGLPARSKRKRASSVAVSDRQTKPERGKNTYMKGRFSGRLPTKDDERKLAEECQLMAPLLSEDQSLCTLPTIIRAMATGSVRAYLERQKETLDSATAKLDVINSLPEGATTMALSEKIVGLQAECAQLRRLLAVRDEQLAEAGLSPRAVPLEAGHIDGAQAVAGAHLGPSAAAAAAALTPTPEHQFPSGNGLQHVESQLQFAQQPSLPVQSINVNPTLMSGPIVSTISEPQHQMPVSVQQVVMTTTVPVPVPVAVQSSAVAMAPTSVLCTVPSSGSLLQPSSTAAVQQAVQQEHLTPSLPAHIPAQEDSTVSATAVAASSLNEHAQQLAVTAKLHEVAKTEASAQAQQLAATAQQHAQASVQAAQKAEELKKTLAVLPDSQEAQKAAATVQDLEVRAQVHASITTQVVAQARGMHEKAQAHEKEQLKAISQASMLQAHAQSLHASSQMEMPQQPLNPSHSHQSLISSAPGQLAGAPNTFCHAVTTQERPTTPHFGASAVATNVVTSGDPFGAGLIAPPLTLTRPTENDAGGMAMTMVTPTGANIIQCDQPIEVSQPGQQQYALIQPPQQVGAVSMPPQVGTLPPPSVTVQVLPRLQNGSQQQQQQQQQQQWSHQSGTPREATTPVLMHCGSSSIVPDQNSLPLMNDASGAPKSGENFASTPVDNGVNGMIMNGFNEHEQAEKQQGLLTANLPQVDLEQLPSLQPLTSDPTLAGLTAAMDPVIEIPGPQVSSFQPLPGSSFAESPKYQTRDPAILPVSSPALPAVSAGL